MGGLGMAELSPKVWLGVDSFQWGKHPMLSFGCRWQCLVHDKQPGLVLWQRRDRDGNAPTPFDRFVNNDLPRMKKQASLVSAPTDQITVLLADDHPVFRKSLRELVELEEDIEVVGEATNGREVVELNQSLQPEVIIMDMAMPLLNGLEATELIRETHPKTRVIMLSANSDPEYIEQAMLCGASGYLIKQSSAQFLAKGIREVQKGNTFFSASISRELRGECRIIFGKGELVKRTMAQMG